MNSDHPIGDIFYVPAPIDMSEARKLPVEGLDEQVLAARGLEVDLVLLQL